AGYSVSRTGIRFLAAAGFLAAAISVRLSWQESFPAQIYDVKAAIRRLRAHAGDYPIDPARIGLMGDSAGGHLAALAALTGDNPDLEGDSRLTRIFHRRTGVRGDQREFRFPQPDLDTDHAPPANPIRFCRDLHPGDAFAQLFGGPLRERADLMRLASPIRYVNRTAPPFLIIHGTRDETVPFEQGQRLHHALQTAGADTTLIPIEGGHHNLRDQPDLPYGGEIWDDVTDRTVEFFRRHLERQAA
ncbi:MAG: alpha/beta hydrolase, partial [Mycobacterium sp.]|nr:alpha/beta hydrolase [Mycobacterium sp.]